MLKTLLVPTRSILLIGHHDMLDAEQRDDEAVALGLRLHAVAGVDQDDGQIAGGCAGGHVARVLLMTGRVGDDEFALARWKNSGRPRRW